MDLTRVISDLSGITMIVAVIFTMILTIVVTRIVSLGYVYYAFHWVRNKYNGSRPETPRSPVDETESIPSVLKEMHLKMVDSVKCPICLSIAIPPLALCSKGHFVCSSCRPKIQRCGLCLAYFTTARNFAIENIVSAMETNCPHAGCPKIVKIEEISKHMKECAYRPFYCKHCPWARRREHIEWKDFTSHLTETHECLSLVNLIPGKFYTITYDLLQSYQLATNIGDMSQLWLPTILTLINDGSTFFVNIKAEESTAFISISVLSPQDYGRYVADILISKNQIQANEQANHFKYVVTLNTAPLHMAWVLVKYSKYCAAIPLRTLLQLSDQEEDGSWSFSLDVCLRLA